MDIKRIIVSRTDKIGDLILSIPSFFYAKGDVSRGRTYSDGKKI